MYDLINVTVVGGKGVLKVTPVFRHEESEIVRVVFDDG